MSGGRYVHRWVPVFSPDPDPKTGHFSRKVFSAAARCAPASPSSPWTASPCSAAPATSGAASPCTTPSRVSVSRAASSKPSTAGVCSFPADSSSSRPQPRACALGDLAVLLARPAKAWRRTRQRPSAARSGRRGRVAGRGSARAPTAQPSAARGAEARAARCRRAAIGQLDFLLACAAQRRAPRRGSPAPGCARRARGDGQWIRERKRSSSVLRRCARLGVPQLPATRLRHQLDGRLAVAVLQILVAQPVTVRRQQRSRARRAPRARPPRRVAPRPAPDPPRTGRGPDAAQSSCWRRESGRHIGMSLPATSRPPLQ